MFSPDKTTVSPMARIQPYKESGLHKLEELHRQNFPHLDDGRL